MFTGTIPAMVTPFTPAGEINEEKVRELVQFHLEKKSSGLVVSGTTGESPTLSAEEKKRLFEIVVAEVNGKIPVIAGSGGNDTRSSVELTRAAKDLGVDGALIVAPYYNKPTQEGLYQHYLKIADEGGLPLIVYNVPGRTASNILPETIERFCKHEQIVAVKEACGNLSQISALCRRCGDDLVVLSGDDGLTLEILAVGGKGVISVTGNMVPDLIQQMVEAFLNGDHQKALALHQRLEPLHDIMFLESNPIPVKTAMNLMGMAVGGFRLPLCDMGAVNREKLESFLKAQQWLS